MASFADQADYQPEPGVIRESRWKGLRELRGQMGPLTRIAFTTPTGGPENCIFCRIVSRSAPSNMVYEDDRYVAFLDIYPFSRGHTLVCPKEHGETIWDMKESDIADLFQIASKVSKAVVTAVG